MICLIQSAAVKGREREKMAIKSEERACLDRKEYLNKNHSATNPPVSGHLGTLAAVLLPLALYRMLPALPVDTVGLCYARLNFE